MTVTKDEKNGHLYDDLGICVLCGRCDDPGCCGSVGQCDRSLSFERLTRAARRP